MTADDSRFMAMALALGDRGHGQVWPNPAVGCVIAKDGRVVGRGWTQRSGRPHAEPVALLQAADAARGGTAYVTLEPCAHQGRSTSCTSALVEAGIARVVVAMIDPDPRTNGLGIERLRAAGIAVEVGCGAAEASFAHAGFTSRVTRARPLVALKIAQSLDGRIATASGRSRWITSEDARAVGHWLRATHDAILIGSGTALADDPGLTCRLPGLLDRSPVRVVVDRRLRLKPESELARSARAVPLWIFTGAGSDARAAERLHQQGAELVQLEADAGPEACLAALAARGITRLLVEGGAGIATALLRADLVDRLHLFTAPVLLGGDGRASIAALGLDEPAEARRWRHVDLRQLGRDRLSTLARED